MLLSCESNISIACQFLLRLSHKSVEARLDVRQSVSNMRHEGLIQTLCQELSTTTIGHVPVCGVMLKEVPLGLQSVRKRSAALDVCLRTVDNTNETKLQRVHTSGQDVHGVCSVVHEIQLGENTNRPLAHRVDMAGQLQCFRVDKIDVRGGDSKDDTVRLGDIFGNEISGLLLDICRLVANGYLQLLTPHLFKDKQ